jgi:hypothetical protein
MYSETKTFFKIKNAKYSFSGLHEGLPSYRRGFPVL